MNESLQRLFIAELLKVGYPVISQMGKTIPIPELAPAMPWNCNERTFSSVRTHTVGNKFTIFLYLNQKRQGVPLPYGFAYFDVVEFGQLNMPGDHFSQVLTFSDLELVPDAYRKSYREDLIKSQLEAVAIRMARSIEEVAFQTLFNQLNS